MRKSPRGNAIEPSPRCDKASIATKCGFRHGQEAQFSHFDGCFTVFPELFGEGRKRAKSKFVWSELNRRKRKKRNLFGPRLEPSQGSPTHPHRSPFVGNGNPRERFGVSFGKSGSLAWECSVACLGRLGALLESAKLSVWGDLKPWLGVLSCPFGKIVGLA
jgi:hypothetical protein